MEVLVIGNGFDLAHGLPTGYKDFLDFMKGIKVISYRGYINRKNDFALKLEDIVGHKIKDTVREFLVRDDFFSCAELNAWKEKESSKELITCCEKNVWLQYFLDNQKYIDECWVDFEDEISRVLQSLEYARNLSDYDKRESRLGIEKRKPLVAYEGYDEEKNEVVSQIIKYSNLNISSFHTLTRRDLKELKEVLYNDLIQITRCLEIYLCDYVGEIDIADENIISELYQKKFDRVLSFNYTNTFEKAKYKLKPIKDTHNSSHASYTEQVDYIHGKADLEVHRNKEDNNMVLGIDEYLKDDEKNVKLDFIQFKKYFQRIYKKTGNEYTKWIANMNEYYETKIDGDVFAQQIDNHIYIFGHSLDISDKDILKSLILESGFKNDKDGTYDTNTKVIIYHHDKDAYAQQIANLVRIIGQDELIARVSGENPTIIFKQQD